MQISPLPAADQRSADILARVRIAFAEKGFDGASMQDLARAAGISVGNFYRYFPSKSAIVEALIAFDLAGMEADFQTVMQSDKPMDGLRQLMQQRLLDHQVKQDGQLWAEITAAALRKPDICAAACHMETRIIELLNSVFAKETGRTVAEIAQIFPAHAAYSITMFKAAAMLPPHAEPLREQLTRLIFRNLDQTLNEIVVSKKA